MVSRESHEEQQRSLDITHFPQESPAAPEGEARSMEGDEIMSDSEGRRNRVADEKYTVNTPQKGFGREYHRPTRDDSTSTSANKKRDRSRENIVETKVKATL